MSTITTRCPHCTAKNRLPNERIESHPVCGKCKSPLLSGKPIEGTAENLQPLLDSDTPVVIDFWAPWCNPCVGFAPVFEDVAAEKDQQIRFVKVNTEEQQALASQYRIRSIPSIMVFKNGKLLDTINGAMPKSQFNQWLTSAVAKA
ncbi:thioredoxin TrxC [Thaumasiovibrio subtropicus]|uniref:thioredoxin TrxC n=1 Tax=Thaumasiovibrio subtropicus TaxID=1891207 RepID=UPI000B3540DB|nr:thioredoxin TrxC [Thaumasiovibrio subtropicus]